MRIFAAAALVLAAGTSSGLHPEVEALFLGKGDPGELGLGGSPYPAQRVAFLSRVSIAQMDSASTSANDCWGYVSPSGREIAIIGLESAVSFVDITDPLNPVILATFTSPTSLWHDIKVIGNHAYAVTEGGSHIQVFNLANVDSGTVTEIGFTVFGGSGSTHNIAANTDSGFLYRTGGGNNLGLRVYAVGQNGQPGSPGAPVQVGLQSNLYVHDAQVVNYTSGPWAGREIAFLCSGLDNGGTDTALRIFDVTNKSAMVQLGILRYPGRAYCHQGWLSEDRRYFYVNDELDEGGSTPTTRLHIINVENLNTPTYVKGWTNGNTARDHNCYVRGDYLYAANYRSGLRVHDISDPENPVEVAWIDTFPADDSNSINSGFDGAWSNYPFFPSGNVIISDIQQGLVIVQPEVDRLVFDVFEPLGETVSPAGGELVRATITEYDVTLNPASVRLVIESPAGSTQSIAGSVAAGVATFVMPALDCFDSVTYRVEADATDGRSFMSFPLSSLVATGVETAFADNAESNPGWTVSGNASDGQWTRGVPVNAGRGDPQADADGSGSAWLTDNSSANGGNSDVDNGETVLTGPIIDASAGGTLRYSYWLNDAVGGELGAEDFLRVDLSSNGGASWQTLRTYTTASGLWREDSIELPGEFPASAQLRIRVVAADNSPGDVVEAGLDGISLVRFACEDPGCTNPADANGDGVISPSDFSAWVAAFNAGSPACDQNGDGLCAPSDFSAWVANFNLGCP
jgi:choice-of-anchor B domain-containing protein